MGVILFEGSRDGYHGTGFSVNLIQSRGLLAKGPMVVTCMVGVYTNVLE